MRPATHEVVICHGFIVSVVGKPAGMDRNTFRSILIGVAYAADTPAEYDAYVSAMWPSVRAYQRPLHPSSNYPPELRDMPAGVSMDNLPPREWWDGPCVVHAERLPSGNIDVWRHNVCHMCRLCETQGDLRGALDADGRLSDDRLVDWTPEPLYLEE